MTGEATGEIWTWSLLGVKGLSISNMYFSSGMKLFYSWVIAFAKILIQR